MSVPHILSKAGASKLIISKILAQKLDVLANPYDSLRRVGATVDVADRVAIHLRFPLSKRVLGHAEWILAQRPLNVAMLTARLQFSMEMPKTTANTMIRKVLDNGRLVQIRDQVVPLAFYQRCVDVVTRVKARLDHVFPSHALLTAFDAVTNVSDSQRAALDMVAKHRLSIITGGPGTGKSHVVREMVAAHPTMRVTAPTGRAARNARGKTVHYFKTIQESGKNDFRDADLIVIEEASMLSTDLFWTVLSMAPDEAHVVLVGDVDQLPPIDVGDVLRDLLHIVPVTRLENNVRSDAGIDTFAKRLLRGTVRFDDVDGIEMYPCDMSSDVVDFLATFVPATPDESVMVLTPHNKTRVELNKVLQFKRWAREAEVDIVLAKDFPDAPRGTRGIAHMSDANLVKVHADNDVRFSCSLSASTSLVAMDTRAGGIQAEDSCVIVPGDAVIVTKNTATACNGDVGTYVHPHIVRFQGHDAVIPTVTDTDPGMTLAYCITVHKAQGSEFDTVIVPVTNISAWDLALLYTAVTRAKTKVIFLGTQEDVEKIVRCVRLPRPSILTALFS